MNPKGENFSNALSFCFENLFEKFGEEEKIVIYCLVCARKPLTIAEIHFLLPALTDQDAEIALSALHNSSIVLREKTEGNSLEYSLSDSASRFLNDKSPPTDVFFRNIQLKLRELRTIYTKESKKEAIYDYNPYFVRVESNRDGMIAANYLRSALNFLKSGDIGNARLAAHEARKLTQNSSEVWRICGLIEAQAQELYKALSCFEHAITLAPLSRITIYCYGMFLFSDMDDFEGALEQFETLERVDPSASPALTAKAMCLTRLGRLAEAAVIHEELLKSIGERERRWRLTGFDQAVETYRRLFVLDCDQKEYILAKSHAKRSLAILMDAVKRSDCDFKMVKKLAKVVITVLSKSEINIDSQYVESIIDVTEEICKFGNGILLTLDHGTDWLPKNTPGFEGYQARLMDLTFKNKNQIMLEEKKTSSALRLPDLKSQDREFGKIHNITEIGHYGFIVSSNGDRYFTHLTFMRDQAEWSLCVPGVPVSFCIGQNEKGPCAVDVCLMVQSD
ncbi:tetratricopeptide repeat protein [Undibacterium sp. WLX3042]|uniref:tetratricopeptide repeat protein n=1 Tax=Undibacterium sp. WLX3042 TaxID=3412686 RepID=UPI003C2DF109